MDGAQLRAGEGPSVTAFMDTFPVVSDDVQHDPRWPRLTAFLPSQVRGVVAVPLEVGQRVVGSLNVYRTTLGPASALVEANPKEFVLKGKVRRVLSGRNNWASPTLVDGRIYLRDEEKVVCYDVR